MSDFSVRPKTLLLSHVGLKIPAIRMTLHARQTLVVSFIIGLWRERQPNALAIADRWTPWPMVHRTGLKHCIIAVTLAKVDGERCGLICDPYPW